MISSCLVRNALVNVFTPRFTEKVNGWERSPRGSGYLFGDDVSWAFAHVNRLQLIARSHQLVMGGYRLLHDDLVATVWSAPNYMYRLSPISPYAVFI